MVVVIIVAVLHLFARSNSIWFCMFVVLFIHSFIHTYFWFSHIYMYIGAAHVQRCAGLCVVVFYYRKHT